MPNFIIHATITNATLALSTSCSSGCFMPYSCFTVEQIFWFLRKNSPRFLGFLDHVYPLHNSIRNLLKVSKLRMHNSIYVHSLESHFEQPKSCTKHAHMYTYVHTHMHTRAQTHTHLMQFTKVHYTYKSV